MPTCKDDCKGTSIEKLPDNIRTRQLTASFEIESSNSLRDSFGMPPPSFWEWRFLWNWKAAYNKYQMWKLEKELAKIMAEEIRKELDAEFIKKVREQLENETVS